MDFKGKIAVITGGAQGIGRCIAEEFQKAGATACVIDKAGFITGENICIDGGMTHQMIYHGDHGWTLGVKTDKD
jgi:Dehydrogenases with different specificities (related to short-chain alcohol dehydrogenases)